MTIVGSVIEQVASAEAEIGVAVSSKKISGQSGTILRECFARAIFEMGVRAGLQQLQQEARHGGKVDSESQRQDGEKGD